MNSRPSHGSHRQPQNPPTSTLKIIVVGTPKTGNTWVKHLLADAYGLPQVKLASDFDLDQVEAAGARWISHQHFLPNHNLITWGAANHVVFVSVVRHPGDVLVSLWHHMKNRRDREPLAGDDSAQATAMLRDGPDAFGAHTRAFVAQGFPLYLNLSIAWLSLPVARAVRYEDLWVCPLEALRALTASILPLPDERLRLALCACELGLMQSLLDPEKKFLRQGGIGGWRTALPTEVKQQLTSLDPYPAQFAALGYTMDETHPANTPRPAPARVVGPFGADHTFADGTPVPAVLMKAYFDLSRGQRATWPDPRSTADDSFFNWLNRPATADPHRGHAAPVITELAHYLHAVRPDVRQFFPDPFGAHRSAFYDWFLFNARQEYGLPHCFAAQNPFSDARQFSDGTRTARVLVRIYLDLPEALRRRWPDPSLAGENSFLAWLNSPAAADPAGGTQAPFVTALGAYLHDIRPDVQASMPGLYSSHRVDFAKWFLSSAAREYELDRAFTLPVIRSWAELADRVPAHVCQLARGSRHA